MNRRARGFTLIELMVVAVLVSIMLAIAVPSFTSFISNYRATAAINEVLQGITMTRGEALKRGRKVTMSPVGGDWRNGWNIFLDTGAPPNQVYSSGETLIFTHPPLPASIRVAGVNYTGTPFITNYVVFDGTGYPKAPTLPIATMGVGITILDTFAPNTNNANYRTLCLAAFGRPRIIKGPPDPCTAG